MTPRMPKRCFPDRRTLTAGALAVVVGLLAAACGSKGPGGSPSLPGPHGVDTALCPFPLAVTVTNDKPHAQQFETRVLRFAFVGPTTIELRNVATGRTANPARPQCLLRRHDDGLCCVPGAPGLVLGDGQARPLPLDRRRRPLQPRLRALRRHLTGASDRSLRAGRPIAAVAARHLDTRAMATPRVRAQPDRPGRTDAAPRPARASRPRAFGRGRQRVEGHHSGRRRAGRARRQLDRVRRGLSNKATAPPATCSPRRSPTHRCTPTARVG